MYSTSTGFALSVDGLNRHFLTASVADSVSPSGRLEEKEIVLDVSRRLLQILEQETGVKVVLTRSADAFVKLRQRVARAHDSGGDVFVSIHVNGCRSRSARGAEVFFLSPKGAYRLIG